MDIKFFNPMKVATIAAVIFLGFFLISQAAYSATEMSEYCYLPPFVMDANTPPNVLIIYEKGADILKRAYSTTYISGQTYYGFFEATSYYAWSASDNAFVKSTSCSPASTRNCISGNILNWALMSSIDLSRRALVGFGWPDVGASSAAGEVFTYSGNFNGGRLPISYGQWRAGNSTSVNTVVNAGGTNYAYSFCISQAVGSNPTGLTVRANTGTSAPSCSGSCSGTCSTVVNNGSVAMKFTTETKEGSTAIYRRGIIQKYIDENMDYYYDTEPALRVGVRRWHNGNDKQEDIIKNTALTVSERNSYYKSILTAISKAPPDDPNTAYLGGMMKDNINYYSGSGCSYCDNDGWTQTPYNWSTDPGKACRKNFVLYMSTGANLGQNTDKMASLPTACNSLDYTDAFPTNTCYAYNTDLSSETGNQNVKTFVVHVNYGGGWLNENQMRYASADIGGGEYIKVEKPSDLENKLEEAFINILSTAASASTVATLTTQTRESSTLTQAYFYPRLRNTKLKWIGYGRLLWSDSGANLREDTENTGVLDLIKDKILSFFYDAATSSYKAKTYNDANGDCRIDACSGTPKENDAVLPIWEAQSLLTVRTPDESASLSATDPKDRKRIIKTAIGNTSGVVASGTTFTDFTTSIAATLQPYWNYSSFCSDVTTRWCAADNDCNKCAGNPTTRTCPGGSNSDCYYCSLNTSVLCPTPGSTGSCVFDYAPCVLTTKYCTNNPGASCTADSDCSSYAVCTNSDCLYNPGNSCTTNADCSGLCKGTCTGDSARFCLSDANCQDNFGTCTADTCTTASSGTCTKDCDNNCASSIIKYVRGYDKPNPSGGEFRIRHICTTNSDCPSGTCQTGGICSDAARDITKTLKLGDIVYSTPRISPNSAVSGYAVRYNDDTYREFITNTMKTQMPVVIMGANDGMVHAFKLSRLKDISPPTASDGGKQVALFTDDGTSVPADLGSELWSFVPYNALPFLRWYCKDSYCHIPMLDARFTILDASINGAAGGTRGASSWRRLLIGAMGIGGKKITIGTRTWSSSLFVIDITDPANPVLKWERPLPDNSLTTSNPGIVRLGAKTANGSWYIVLGSGPDNVSTQSIAYTPNTKIYVFDLRDGTPTEIDLGVANSAVGDILSTDLDGDYQVDDLYFGTYGLSGGAVTGKLFRLRLRSGSAYLTTPSSWVPEIVINVNRPIFASPEIAQDAKGNIWLYFGTGIYLTLSEAKATTTAEYIYGFVETESCWKNGCGSPYGNFYDVAAIVSGAAATEVGCFCEGNMISSGECTAPGSCGNVTCGSGEGAVVLKVQGATLSGGPSCNGLQDENAMQCLADYIVNNYNGWRRSLPGEKIFSKPFIAGGLVDFTSFKPVSTPCTLGGTTQLMAINYTTGTPYIQPAIYLSAGTSGSYSSVNIEYSVSLGAGVPPLGESLVALPLAGDTYKVITQVSGALPGTALNPSAPYKQGYVLWLMK